MVIKLEKALNLFIPAAPLDFQGFKESFSIDIESAEVKEVDTDIVRERIIAKKPDLEKSLNDFMPSMETLSVDGLQMMDLSMQGTDDAGNSINRIVSLNRLLSYDKNNSFDNVYRKKRVGNKDTFELNISNITFDVTSKTVIFE